MSAYKFDDLPNVVATLVEEVKSLRHVIDERLSKPQPEQKSVWMDVKELQKFLPDHPAAPTVYGWIRNGLIPYYKKGKKLSFKRSEIEEWMNSGRQQTEAEIAAAAEDYVNRKRLGNRASRRESGTSWLR